MSRPPRQDSDPAAPEASQPFNSNAWNPSGSYEPWVPPPSIILEKTEDILKVFERANNLPGEGELDFINRDIEGCFPNMPKKAIQFGLRFITENLKKTGKKGVFVPKRSSKQPCMWNTKRKDMMFMSFHDLHDIMQFALQNTFITLNGKVLRQKKGIPMGEPCQFLQSIVELAPTWNGDCGCCRPPVICGWTDGIVCPAVGAGTAAGGRPAGRASWGRAFCRPARTDAVN